MPELPEVERVRLSLEPHVVGRRVAAVELLRGDVVEGDASAGALLAGRTVTRIDRLGKQLALVGDGGRVVCVHLGMTGSLRFVPEPPTAWQPHTHVVWRLAGGGAMAFRDPRRFGGVWTYPTEAALRERRWRGLGPDALRIRADALHRALSRTRRPLKAALLDQGLVAGLGNIYVDELLYACRLSPLVPASGVTPTQAGAMASATRRLLRRAIDAGGSTLRDYVDGNGAAGGFQNRHQVYGRAGQPCRRCRTPLAGSRVAGRMTVYCGRCQAAADLPEEG